MLLHLEHADAICLQLFNFCVDHSTHLMLQSDVNVLTIVGCFSCEMCVTRLGASPWAFESLWITLFLSIVCRTASIVKSWALDYTSSSSPVSRHDLVKIMLWCSCFFNRSHQIPLTSILMWLGLIMLRCFCCFNTIQICSCNLSRLIRRAQVSWCIMAVCNSVKVLGLHNSHWDLSICILHFLRSWLEGGNSWDLSCFWQALGRFLACTIGHSCWWKNLGSCKNQDLGNTHLYHSGVWFWNPFLFIPPQAVRKQKTHRIYLTLPQCFQKGKREKHTLDCVRVVIKLSRLKSLTGIVSVLGGHSLHYPCRPLISILANRRSIICLQS